jgi:molybdopterin molybdotransferase
VTTLLAEKTKDMLGRQRLTPVPEALALLLDSLDASKQPSECIALDLALDRITAREIVSPEDLPSQARSTMDGFAVKAADTFGASQSTPAYLEIRGEVLMGEKPRGEVTQGNCYRISTGGLLPTGSDAVIMLEHTIPIDDHMIELVKSVGAGTNLIDKGEDICRGKVALAAGHLLRPQDLGLLAGLGITEIEVTRRVKIGILSTGDEIVPWSETPPAGKIRNINAITLAGLSRRTGAEVVDYGIVTDSEENFFSTMQQAITENDIVIFSGGSSVGMRDLGERVIQRLGNPGILVHGVTLKPGKPIIIGLHNGKPLFGLPGHPVSAMVCFELFVEPAIQLLSGHKKDENIPRPTIEAVLERNINSAAGRLDLVRVQIKEKNGTLLAKPVLGKSGSISTLSRAHGYFRIDESLQGLAKDSVVNVHMLQ